MPKFGECPLPNPPPQGRERVAADFAISGNLKHSLGLQPLISGRLKNKKQPVQPIFLAEPLIPTATRPLSRGRELERGQQAVRLVFGRLGYWERLPRFGRIPSPQPSPTGEGADCSGFKRRRPSEKRMPETSTTGIFQVAFIARQMEQTPRAFFQTTFEPIGRVCAARHARGGLGLQGKWRTRACVPHTPYMRATACCFPCKTLHPNSHPVLSPVGES